MCLGSSRNRRGSQANGRVPALSKARLLDVWRFTVCSLWMSVNLECIFYLVQQQRETDNLPIFSFQSYHSSQSTTGHGRKEKKENVPQLGLWATKLGTELPKLRSETRQTNLPGFCCREGAAWASGRVGVISYWLLLLSRNPARTQNEPAIARKMVPEILDFVLRGNLGILGPWLRRRSEPSVCHSTCNCRWVYTLCCSVVRAC